MRTQHSGYSGFLDGYKAQNLESVASSANFHIEQMNELISAILKQHKESTKLSFLKEISPARFTTSSLLAVGEALKTTIVYAKASERTLLGQKEFKLLVFHFMEAAKLSSDNTVINLALDVGEQASS